LPSPFAEPFLACDQCDLVHADVPLEPGTSARCRRCGAILARSSGAPLGRPLALAAGALVMFVVANANPILELEVNGVSTSATLLGAVGQLWSQGMWAVGSLVAMTTFVCPLAQLLAMCFVMLPLRDGVVPPGFSSVLRLIQLLQPWGMLEVFVLGTLISAAKLVRIASVVPDVGLWSFGLLVLLTAGAAMSFDCEDLWRRADALAARSSERNPGGGS
jgi:paraquat-inducible protein A